MYKVFNGLSLTDTCGTCINDKSKYSFSIWFVTEVFFHGILPSKPFPDSNDPGFNFATQYNQTCEYIEYVPKNVTNDEHH